ncbi:MAG TPA: DUF1501 domain-containing protein [Bacteroidia bacterium]|jgi:uncharacterized protein (DUF1501 family)|nr:DUF1501 domain-containing protein [Bacteroidia bacterium]
MANYSRKDFLKLAGLVSTSFLLPNFLRGNNKFANQLVNRLALGTTNGKRLVVIQFSGGNDGLNTIVPFADDLYHSARPGLGLMDTEIIKIDQHMAFNSALQGLADLHNDGHAALLNSVGYPNPNRSHFRSMDIWQTASDEDKFLASGWVGRWLDATCDPTNVKPHFALEIDDNLSLALKGEKIHGIAMQKPARLETILSDPLLQGIATEWSAHDDDHHNVEYLHKSLAEVNQSAGYLKEHLFKKKSTAIYPQHAFGNHMKLIAELILADCETPIYYVSLPGFDTHAAQKDHQNKQLKVYADSLKAFATDLKGAGMWNDTLVMTFSEFGRRVKQNASKGTDHGTANVMMFAGGSLLKKGLLNEAPDLSDLDNGDLKFKVDFRQVYATVLKNWLQADADIILGQPFQTLDFI